MRKHLLAFVLLLGSLAGCVWTPQNITLTQPPASLPAENPSGLAEIYLVCSDSAAWAGATGAHVNGENIGRLKSNDFAHKSVPAGTVQVKATAEKDCEATFPVVANQAYYIAVIPKRGNWHSRVQLELMDPVAGRAAVAKYNDKTRTGNEPPPP